MKRTSQHSRILPVLLLVVTLPLLTAWAGLLIAKVTNTSDMGWDQLGSAFGGLVLGGAAGLIGSVVLARWLAVRQLRIIAALTTLGVAILITFVVIRVRASAETQRVAPPLQPTAPAAH
jgi:hypothetical protein